MTPGALSVSWLEACIAFFCIESVLPVSLSVIVDCRMWPHSNAAPTLKAPSPAAYLGHEQVANAPTGHAVHVWATANSSVAPNPAAAAGLTSTPMEPDTLRQVISDVQALQQLIGRERTRKIFQAITHKETRDAVWSAIPSPPHNTRPLGRYKREWTSGLSST